MLVRVVLALLVVVALLAAAAWLLSAPRPLAATDLPDHEADAANGERVFHAAGCASCHAAQNGAARNGGDGEGGPRLAGGLALETPIGTFVAPNISPHPRDGIGNWSTLDFVNATMRGISPDGRHYYPAFPWTSYRRMRIEDAIDLEAYVRTLPPVAGTPDEATRVDFPYGIRRGIGLWKRFAMPGDPPAPTEDGSEIARGAYLVAALGHCGECHTPRDALYAEDMSRWLAGAPSLTGRGSVPNITPSEDGIGGWSAGDIAYLLETGFTPEFDSVGGHMASVVDNWSQVPAEDRQAVAAYLKAVAPRPSAPTE